MAVSHSMRSLIEQRSHVMQPEVMATLPIVIYPEPILKLESDPVEQVDDSIRTLLDDMTETMYAANGIGLAAPQVNVKLRVIVVDVREPVPMCPDDEVLEQPRRHCLYQLVNPKIVARSGSIIWEEGCLSLPDLLIEMSRSAEVTVSAQDRNGKPIEVEAKGLLAVALQHEIDHLQGKLIVDKLSKLKRGIYLDKLKKKALDR